MEEKKDNVPISFRLPHEIWFALKILDAKNEIDSLQAACIEGLERVIMDRKGEGEG